MPDPTHFAVPFRLGSNGAFATNVQDSVDEISACVASIITTPAGSRIEVPAYGAPRYEFGTVRPEELAEAVAEWEPRADIDVTVLDSVRGIDGLTDVIVAVRPHL